MIVGRNPINLREATVSERELALSMLPKQKHNIRGYSPGYGPAPEYVLVSETAFEGHLSFYTAINLDGELVSTGWIGKS